MGRKSKKQKTGYKNVQNARHVRTAAKNRGWQESSAGDSDDNYEPPKKQQRHFDNSSTLVFMMIGSMGSIMRDFAVCAECKTGTLDVSPISNNGYNTNLAFTCNFCRVERRKWTGENNMTDAVFMAAKYSGIKSGQLENWSKCMNMGHTNAQGNHTTVTTKSRKAKQTNEKLNILLDEMKNNDEQEFHRSLLETNNMEDIKLAVDGMYPIRNNSGICVSTVMAKINGKCRIIGKIF